MYIYVELVIPLVSSIDRKVIRCYLEIAMAVDTKNEALSVILRPKHELFHSKLCESFIDKRK